LRAAAKIPDGSELRESVRFTPAGVKAFEKVFPV
jgi:hypothetical protein